MRKKSTPKPKGVASTNYLLSLDISLTCTGFVVCRVENGKLVIRDSGIIRPVMDKSNSHDGYRLLPLARFIESLYETYSDLEDYVVRERGFGRFNNETQAIFKAHGVVEYVLHDKDIISYAPKTVKAKVTGNGNAKKESVEKHVRDFLADPNFVFLTNDVSDAAAVAITHFLATDYLVKAV